ncbi:MAG: deoxyribonuclease I [Planctomycetota bacterium]
MSEDNQSNGHPIQVVLVVVMLSAGAWYFVQNYDVDGLGGLSIQRKAPLRDTHFADPFTFTSSVTDWDPRDRDATTQATSGSADANMQAPPTDAEGPWDGAATWISERTPANPTVVEPDPVIYSPSDVLSDPSRRGPRRVANLRVASWALDGFGVTKLSSLEARSTLVRVIRQFDIIALQQVDAARQDIVPRITEAVNESSIGGGGAIYDFVLGVPQGEPGDQEQLAILFNPNRVRVDRTQTYSVADPQSQMTFDPLVAWFRAAEVDSREAWTFSLVNVRIELARAQAEVALLREVMRGVRDDGRQEDDVVMVGLMQADDAYLMPALGAKTLRAAVTSTPTDVFGRHQTANVLFDHNATAEAIGHGGVFDFLRVYNLSLAQAQAVSSHLPVYAEFSPTEGSPLLIRNETARSGAATSITR